MEPGTSCRLKIKFPDSCAVTLAAVVDQDDYHTIGLVETFVPPSEFKDYEFTFVAHDGGPGNNRIGFDLGASRGKVMVKEIVILKKSPRHMRPAPEPGRNREARSRELRRDDLLPTTTTKVRCSIVR